MSNILAAGTASGPVEKRDGGPRTPAVAPSPAIPKPTGDPAPRNRPPAVQQTVENYGVQSDRGEKPTKKLYRQGVRIT